LIQRRARRRLAAYFNQDKEDRPKMSGRRAQQTSQWRKQRIQVNPSQVPPKTDSLILTKP
jgi:hypothetical protein